MLPQDLIADAVVDTDLFGEQVRYHAHGEAQPRTLRAMVMRPTTEPDDSDVGAPELPFEVQLRRADLQTVTAGQDQIELIWRGALKWHRVVRILSEDESLWHVEAIR